MLTVSVSIQMVSDCKRKEKKRIWNGIMPIIVAEEQKKNRL